MANCFRQFVCLIDDQCLVVFQQGLPPVLPVGCVCQQVIVIADLNGNRCTVGIFQILSIPAIGVQDAAAAATLRNTDQTAIMTRYSRQKIQVQALVGSAQGSCTPAEPFATNADLLLSNQKPPITSETFFSFSQHSTKHSTNRLLNISILY